MESRRAALVLLGLSILMIAVSAQATQVRYKFSVTAWGGPLAGVSSAGTFAFDDSIIPAGGGVLSQIDLLSDLNFTWNSIAYDETTANTGMLYFDEAGNLVGVGFGDHHQAGGVHFVPGQDSWGVAGSGLFTYSVLGIDATWQGSFSYGRVPGVSGDYDEDGRADIAIYRSSTGAWYIYPSSGATPYGLGWGGDTGDIPAPGDYDGDGKTDLAVYRYGRGTWYIIPSGGGSPYAVGGVLGYTPVPGDYDGDGKTDIAIDWMGTWYIIPSGSGSPYSVGQTMFYEQPAPGDYDGDGKTDIATYQSGTWCIYPSGGGTVYSVRWGIWTDKPIPRDYDGDGKTDLAVYRDGVWFVSPSGGGTPYALEWGIVDDIPVPGDYDGDGMADIAVYRPGTGVWYIIPSGGASPYGIGWGGDPSDIPLTTNPN